MLLFVFQNQKMKIASMVTMITATMTIITVGHTYTGTVAAAAAMSALKSVIVLDVVFSSVVVTTLFVQICIAK